MSEPRIVVLFATPSLDHRVTLEYLRSWTETVWALTAKGIGMGRIDRGGDQFIAKARSKLATEFLLNYPMATDLFFLDDDISWPPAKIIEFLERPEDIVAGIYPKKQDKTDFPVELQANLTDGSLIENDGLLKAHGVPTGFLRIKRRVLEKLAESAPRFKEEEADGQIREFIGFFQSGIGPDGFWWGEDYTFCRNVTDSGFDIWVDPNILFWHRGNKAWSATLVDYLDKFREKGKMASELYAREKLKEAAE